MPDEVVLNLDPRTFMNIVPQRKAAIEAASDAPPPAALPVNALARALHPEIQRLVISEVRDHGGGARSYTLTAADVQSGVPVAAGARRDAPANAHGGDPATTNAQSGDPAKSGVLGALAYFNAGQYISVLFEIGNSKLYKPYSIRSSPSEALDGRYVITIKKSDDGFASRYIYDNWKVGDRIAATGPEGNFTYEPLRDAPKIVGLTGGSSITPFFSLAGAIADGTEDCDLTLLYGSRVASEILLKDELDALCASCPRIKVIHILSDESQSGYENGFITAELIKKYAPEGDYSLFICGPQAMVDFVDCEIEKLSLPGRRIRRELYGQINNPEGRPGYPAEVAGKTFTLSVRIRSEEKRIACAATESLLVAMERAGIAAPSRCRSGECGFCHSRLVSGGVYTPPGMDKRREADAVYGYIHPCVCFPTGDVALEIPM